MARPGFGVQPAQESPGRDNGDELADGRAQGFAEAEQALALAGRDDQPLGQPGAEDLVLGLEVLDMAGQGLVGRGGQEQQ